MDTPELHIKCVFNSETGEFGGMLSSPKVGSLGPITGRFPSILFEKSKLPTKRGAPKKTGRHIAKLMHVLMAKERYQESLKKARLRAADVLAIGNREHPDNVVRQMIRDEKLAEEHLSQGGMGGDMVFYSADDDTEDGEKSHLMIMDKSCRPRIHQDEQTQWHFAGDGHGWLCHWGDKRARYGRIKFDALLDKKPSTLGLEKWMQL